MSARRHHPSNPLPLCVSSPSLRLPRNDARNHRWVKPCYSRLRDAPGAVSSQLPSSHTRTDRGNVGDAIRHTPAAPSATAVAVQCGTGPHVCSRSARSRTLADPLTYPSGGRRPAPPADLAGFYTAGLLPATWGSTCLGHRAPDAGWIGSLRYGRWSVVDGSRMVAGEEPLLHDRSKSIFGRWWQLGATAAVQTSGV